MHSDTTQGRIDCRPVGETAFCRPYACSVRIDRLLSLAAAPACFAMCAVTGLRDDPATILCSGASTGMPLHGMLAMYVLMGAIHLGPWIRVCRRWRAHT